ncbi:helix-turn-helix domain-containing protein, partial [Bacillus sp. SIMBA_161]
YTKDVPKIEAQPTAQLSRKKTYAKTTASTSRAARWAPIVRLAPTVFLLITAVYFAVRSIDFGGQDASPTEPPSSSVTVDQNEDVPADEPVEE